MNELVILAMGFFVGGVISYAYFNLSEMIKAIQRTIDEWEEEPEVTIAMLSEEAVMRQRVDMLLALSDEELREEVMSVGDDTFYNAAEVIVKCGLREAFMDRLKDIGLYEQCAIVRDIMSGE